MRCEARLPSGSITPDPHTRWSMRPVPGCWILPAVSLSKKRFLSYPKIDLQNAAEGAHMTLRLCLSGAITPCPLRPRSSPVPTFLTYGIPPLFQSGAVWPPKNRSSARAHAAEFGIRFFIGRCAMVRQAFRLKIESVPLRNNTDRRSYGDRRKTCARTYFLNGGKERRSWTERRYIWDMTR